MGGVYARAALPAAKGTKDVAAEEFPEGPEARARNKGSFDCGGLFASE